jgi:hypothetical protein
MSAAIVQLILGLIAALPSELVTLQGAYQSIKALLPATDAATIDAAFAAANTQLDTDMAQFDADAAAHGG